MLLRSTAALAMAISLGACAPLHTGAAPVSQLPNAAPIIQVENQHAEDMRVYLWAEPGASLWRLGVAPSKGKVTFRVPRHFWDRPVRLVLQPFAGPGEEFATEPLVPLPGHVIDLRVDVVLNRSFALAR